MMKEEAWLPEGRLRRGGVVPEKPKQLPVVLFARSHAGEATCWCPSADIYRTRTGWLLKFDLAGVRLEDVDVEIEGCRVTVRGLRRDWLLEEGYSHYSMEIAYNRFERTIELPCKLAHPRLHLDYEHGILIIRLDTEEGHR
jgi:HSP20 family protein